MTGSSTSKPTKQYKTQGNKYNNRRNEHTCRSHGNMSIQCHQEAHPRQSDGIENDKRKHTVALIGE